MISLIESNTGLAKGQEENLCYILLYSTLKVSSFAMHDPQAVYFHSSSVFWNALWELWANVFRTLRVGDLGPRLNILLHMQV